MKKTVFPDMAAAMAALLLTAFMTCASAMTRRALTVFIGEYPEESGWNRTAADNDKAPVLKMLEDNGFLSSDIICLTDRDATFKGITAALEHLTADCKPGDQVYVHFSCHGQQITDLDGDEALTDPKDRYDEAIVPYDACIAYGWNGYRGENHLTDDVLNRHFNLICRKIGKKGCLLVVTDACHSGGIERGEDDDAVPPYRGTFDAFELPFTALPEKPEIHPVTWISISACKDFQTNFEVNAGGTMHGRLSYAMTRCFHAGMTAAQLAGTLKKEYDELPMPPGKTQTPAFHIPEKMDGKILFGQ